MGSGCPHWLLGADHRSPCAHLLGEAGVLGGENRLGTLAFRTNRDGEERHRRHHSGPSGGPGAGMCPVDSAHFLL